MLKGRKKNLLTLDEVNSKSVRCSFQRVLNLFFFRIYFDVIRTIHPHRVQKKKVKKEQNKERQQKTFFFEAEVKAFIGQWVSCSCAQAYGTIKY